MFVHRIDPVIAQVAGVALWYYGLAYSLGLLAAVLWLRRNARRLGLSSDEVLDAGILIALGVLVGGRLVEVVFYEWDLYGDRPGLIPAYWLGGMATHGILVGTAAAVFGFCRWRGKSFLALADELVVAGALIMGLGRLGNFVDGQIVGAPTEGWWGVVFPDAEGARHPVVLYDGIKNLLLIPLLLWVRERDPPPGVVTAHFFFWYGALRVLVDLFREYRVEVLGLGTGQAFNLAMAAAGLALYLWARRRPAPIKAARPNPGPKPSGQARFTSLKHALLALLILFPLVIPSDWTQDVPARYGARHPGLVHSALYPPIPERAPKR